MPRIINFRPLFYCFLAFAIGIGFANYIFSLNFLIIGIASAGAIALFLISYFRKVLRKLLCVFVAFIVGIGFFYIDFAIFSGTDYSGETVSIYGRVNDDIYKADTYSYITLQNVRVNGKPQSNISVCISVSSENDSIKAGDYLLFNTELYNYQIFENGQFNSFIYRDNTPYFAYVSISEITIQAGNLTLTEQLKQYIKEIFYGNMSASSAGLAYSVIFGDKANLNETIIGDFRITGIAHLLAVSGLHIGFLVAILFFVLKKFGCQGVKRFIIIALFLFLYSYLCEFSPSVVRASIMCLAFLATKIFGKQYDLLNSIGIAGIIILLLWPLYVFDVGFLMSFASVLAIALFFKTLAKFFIKIKIPKIIGEALAIEVCTITAILPLIAIFSTQLSHLTLIANLICIPIFAVGYMFLFVLTIFVSVFQFLGFFLMAPNLIFKALILIANFFANIDWAIAGLVALNIGIATAFYLILFILSRFFLVNFWKKAITILCVVCVCGVLTLSFNSPIIPTKFSYTQLNSGDSSAIITTENGEVLMIGGTGDLDYVSQYLAYQRIGTINTLIITSNYGENLPNFIKNYNIENVVYNTSSLTQVGSFEVQYIIKNNIKKAVYIKTGDFGALFAFNLIGSNQAEEIQNELQDYDIDILYSKSSGLGFAEIFDYKLIASKYKISTANLQNFATMISGSFTFGFENDTIKNIRSVN